MKNETGTGIVKSVGDKKLNVVLDENGKPTAQSEGFFTYTWQRLDRSNLDDALEYFSNADNQLTETDSEGNKIVLGPNESIVELLNRELEREAKANAYQKTVAKFKPAEDPKAAFEKIVRTFMSLGLPEDMATQHARDAVEANKKRLAEAEATA